MNAKVLLDGAIETRAEIIHIVFNEAQSYVLTELASLCTHIKAIVLC
jgi:hypothetical protein